MLGGVEEDISVEEEHAMLTDPNEAVEFVERTGCDSLAVAIGTSHGAYKFSGGQGLHFDRIEKIAQLLPQVPVGHARLVKRAARVGRPHQRCRWQAWERVGRARGAVPARRLAGRDQGQHRH